MTSNHPLLQGMNRQQTAAITAVDGPVLVLAGPGSGKTSVLTRRIAWLIREHRVPHHRIMAVTFTNKAAGEMRSRVEALLGDRLRGLQIGTFHATCARFLRRDAELLGYRKNFVIYDTDDQVAAIKRVMKLLDIDAKELRPREALNRISLAKSEMILPADFSPRDYRSEPVRRIYIAYQEMLFGANAMDFDDLLLNMILLLRKSTDRRSFYQERFEVILVDEFQDTNSVQYELVKLFGAPQNRVFVVGDEDQSIYAFRGADYRNVRRFRKDYLHSQTFLLEQNYRSTQHILNFARTVIDNNPNRIKKALHSDLGLGERVQLTETMANEFQAEYVLERIHQLVQKEGLDYKDIAVMYRSNWLSRAVEQRLMRENVHYVMIGGVGFYKRREVKDMLSYLRLVYNTDDRISFGRVINTPSRGIGDKSVNAFYRWLSQAKLSLGEALEELTHAEPAAIPTRARQNIRKFAIMLADWRQQAARGELIKLFNAIVAQTDYYAHLRKISDNEDELDERWGNVHEMMHMLQRAEEMGGTLQEFLIEQSLYSDTDDIEESDNRVTLITLHSAKGLEFPAVFIVSVDQNVLPHYRSFEEPGGIEEERRLFYVGITRAERFLFLSYTFERGASEFLADLPPHLLDGAPATLATLRRSQSIESQTQWNRDPQPPSRLKRDLRSGSVSAPNEELRKKITPFSGLPKQAENKSSFTIGAKVSHPQFGRGLVVSIEKDMIGVSFETSGLKKVLADTDRFVIVSE